nr:hypothetical protein [Tanacetum cinerariifolium]
NGAHIGYNCLPKVLVISNPKPCHNQNVELAEYINIPSWNRLAFSSHEDDDDEDYTIAITLEEPNNSLSMGDEHLDTISETESYEVIKSSVENLVPILSESEGIPDNACDVPFRDNSPPLDVSDKFIKSSVEDLVPIPSESDDTYGSDSECILPSCDYFSPIDVPEEKSVTFSHPLFNSNDDFTSSDDESLSDKDVSEDNVKIYSNPLFEFDDEYISSDDDEINVLDCEESYYDSEGDILYLESLLNDDLVHRDPSIPVMSVASILEGFTDEPTLEENDDLFDLEPKNDDWKKILYDALIDDLMFEDKIFDPGICVKIVSPTYVIDIIKGTKSKQNQTKPSTKQKALRSQNSTKVNKKSTPTKSKPPKEAQNKEQAYSRICDSSTESPAEQNLPSPSNDPLPSGEDSLKLKELMDLCTNLSNKVLELESEVIDIKSTYQERIEKLEGRVERLKVENRVLKELKSVYSTDDADEPVVEKEKSSKQGRKIAYIYVDVEINLEKAQAEAYNLDLDHQEKVLSMMDVNEEEPTDVEEVLKVVKATKLMTEVVTTAGATKVSVPIKRRCVIIQDPEETTTTATLDEVVARQLEAELNTDINWNVVIEQVKMNERLNYVVMKYQTLKRKPLTQAQARRNMIVYLKTMASFKMDYVKGMTYDEIRPLFEKHYNYNQAFLDEMKEETDELKKHLQIVIDDDDVYTNATPLASKIPIVDYKIHTERNRPYFKIIRADGNHMLFISLSIMLKNFDREDLKSLWKIMRDIFKKTNPKNHSDDYLLNTLKIMFEKPNVEASVWKDQKGRYGLTKIFLLVERMYPLTHFTLEQMLNDVRLQVKDEIEMSIELLRLVRR